MNEFNCNEDLLNRIFRLKSESKALFKESEKLKKQAEEKEQEIDKILLTYPNQINSTDAVEENSKKIYELDGVPDYLNQLARKAVTRIAGKFDYNFLREKLKPQNTNPWKVSLQVIEKENEIKSRYADYTRRYFMDHPLLSKDGVEFFVTTQWATFHRNRLGEKEKGSFIRFKEIMEKEFGILLKEVRSNREQSRV